MRDPKYPAAHCAAVLVSVSPQSVIVIVTAFQSHPAGFASGVPLQDWPGPGSVVS